MERDELRVAVGLMAHLLNAFTATIAHLAEQIPDEEVRRGALEEFDKHAEVARRLAAMFPPDSFSSDDPIFH